MKLHNVNNAYRKWIKFAVIFLIILSLTGNLSAGKLPIGTASADVTPELPVALDGQFNLRIAHTVETPLSVNVVALESRDEDRSLDITIMVSCDIVAIPAEIIVDVRDAVHQKIPEIDEKKIFLLVNRIVDDINKLWNTSDN